MLTYHGKVTNFLLGLVPICLVQGPLSISFGKILVATSLVQGSVPICLGRVLVSIYLIKARIRATVPVASKFRFMATHKAMSMCRGLVIYPV